MLPKPQLRVLQAGLIGLSLFAGVGPVLVGLAAHPRHGFGCAIFPGQMDFFTKGSTAFPDSFY